MNRTQFITDNPPTPKPGCPRCGQEQHCPCSSCAERNKGKVTWKWQADGESVACGSCGLTMHADEWMDIEAAYYFYKFKQ